MYPLVVAALLLNPASLDAKTPPPGLAIPAETAARVRELIQQLDDPSFKVRDKSYQELKKLGRLALPELQEAANNEESNEIRLRCQDLLPSVLAQDFEAKLFAFLADEAGKYRHDLPGWREFNKAVDYHPNARELFSNILRHNEYRDLFAALALPKGEFDQRLIAVKVELYQKIYNTNLNGIRNGIGERYEPKLEDFLAVLFGEVIVGDNAVQGVGVRAITPYTLLLRGTVRNSAMADQYKPIVTKLVELWMDSRTSSAGLSQAMNMATQLGIRSQLPFAYKLITTKGATGYVVAQAVCTIGQKGTREDVSKLVKLFDREDQVYPAINGMAAIQLRDVALAMACHLMELNSEEFKLTSRYPNNAAMKFNYYSHAFASEEDRKAGFEAFRKAAPELFK